MKKPVILLTGFEPFADHERNVTGEAVASLDGEERAEVLLRSLVLPVAWPRARPPLERALDLARPAAVLSFGIHGTRGGAFRIETRAANELRFRIADEDGNRYHGLPVERGAAAVLSTPFAARELLLGLRARGLKARCSRDAGRFLCNAVYFTVLARQHRAVFVHVPPYGPDEPLDPVLAAIEASVSVVARLVGPAPTHSSSSRRASGSEDVRRRLRQRLTD